MKSKIGIVIIDDNELDLMIAERLIAKVDTSYNVKTFSSCDLVHSWLDGDVTDFFAQKVVFFIDIYLSDRNGFDVVNEIRSRVQSPNCKPTFYLLSATLDDSDFNRIEKLPFINGFIGKPITISIINQVMKDFKRI